MNRVYQCVMIPYAQWSEDNTFDGAIYWDDPNLRQHAPENFGLIPWVSFTTISSTLSPWVYAIGVAVIPAAIALGGSNQALQRCGDVITSLLGALEPLTSVLIGIIVFHEALNLQSAIGIVLILIAVTVIGTASVRSKNVSK